ncbi:MAG: septum formation initiator family protein [Rhodobacteraceae bacterium]|nr:septum formation initiator family protein [Paracoccaceae bacterium]
MTRKHPARAIGALMFFATAIALGVYFTFASVQGDYGLFRRIEIEAESKAIAADLADISAQIAVLENKTRRMSDSYLDLDLLDEQARDVLGFVRADDVILR